MVNPIASNNIVLSPPGTVSAMDKIPQNQLARPGVYTVNRPQQQEYYSPETYYAIQEARAPLYRREEHGFARFIGKLVLLAAVVCGGSVLARKHVKSVKNIDLTQELAEGAKVGERIKRKMAQIGDYVSEGFKNLSKKSK